MKRIKSVQKIVNDEFIQTINDGNMFEVNRIINNSSSVLTGESINRGSIIAARTGNFHSLRRLSRDPRLSNNTFINVQFIKAALTRDKSTIDEIYSGYGYFLTAKTINDCCFKAAGLGYFYPLFKLFHDTRLRPDVRQGSQLIEAVLTNDESTIKNILENCFHNVINYALYICYVALAEKEALAMFVKLSEYTKQRPNISINCKFTNAVIARKLDVAQKILDEHGGQLASPIVNVCYLIAIKNGDLCFAFKLTNHPKFEFKTYLTAWGKTAFRDKSRRLRHVDYPHDGKMMFTNACVSCDMVRFGLKKIFKR